LFFPAGIGTFSSFSGSERSKEGGCRERIRPA
jgi:hypothetical protein